MTPGEIVHHNSVVSSLRGMQEQNLRNLTNLMDTLPGILRQLRIVMLVSMALSVIQAIVLFLK